MFQKPAGLNDFAIWVQSHCLGCTISFASALEKRLNYKIDKTYSAHWFFYVLYQLNRAHYKVVLLPLLMLKIENYTFHLMILHEFSLEKKPTTRPKLVMEFPERKRKKRYALALDPGMSHIHTWSSDQQILALFAYKRIRLQYDDICWMDLNTKIS